jgi:hypothetical protein
MKSSNRATPCECLRREFPGEPDAGKLHVRFDEGGVGHNTWHAANEPQRGNPVTDVCRSLNVVTCSSTLLSFVVKQFYAFARVLILRQRAFALPAFAKVVEHPLQYDLWSIELQG